MAANGKTLFQWDPELLARAESLEWKSRVLVEGFLQGMHRSSLRGFSSEFSQYQPYIHGDDPRYLDWRALGRLDRLYIRQFEAETNLRAQFILDSSASMGYQSADVRFRKFDYACLIAATLMRVLQMQNDAFGLALAGSTLHGFAPPRLSRGHFGRCLGMLEHARVEGVSNLATCLDSVAELFTKRGLILLLTDAWDDLENLRTGLQRLRFEHHEVCLFQVADPRELDFAFSDSQLFQDMESGFRLPITPRWNRPRYLAALEKHQRALRELCTSLGVEYTLINTAAPPFEALHTFLAQRHKRRARS